MALLHTFRAVVGAVTVDWPTAGQKTYAKSGITLVKSNADGKDVSVFGLAQDASREELASAGAAFRDAMLACADRIHALDEPPIVPAVPDESAIQARIDAAVKAAVAAALAASAPVAPPVAPPVTPKAPATNGTVKAPATPKAPAAPATTGADAIKSLPF